MKDTAVADHSNPSRAARAVATLVATACLFAPAGAGAASAQGAGGPATPPAAVPTATLEQCVTSVLQSERAATFTGEMTAIPGTARMVMRIDVEERGSGVAEFHTVSAQGLDVWRSSQPKVKVYKYLRQVSNLSSPASYRARVRFRWINAKGHVIRRAERLTSSCLQPAAPAAAMPGATKPEANALSSAGGAATGAPPA